MNKDKVYFISTKIHYKPADGKAGAYIHASYQLTDEGGYEGTSNVLARGKELALENALDELKWASDKISINDIEVVSFSRID